MQINSAQEDHGFPVPLLETLLDRLIPAVGPITKVDILDPDEHSNDRLEVLFRNGRKLVVKRGRYDWMAPRFQASRMAGTLLRREAEVIAPEHLNLPLEVEGHPVLAYWWIELPTLRELWDDLPQDGIPGVMRSWGRLIRKIHGVQLPGYGCLPDLPRLESGLATGLEGAMERPELEDSVIERSTRDGPRPAKSSPIGDHGVGLAGFLQRDVVKRLLPAVRWEWKEGAPSVERLAAFIPRVCERVTDEQGVLVHNDLHMANILCDVENGNVECVGILDLEACIAAPPEADLASAEVLQGPCFFHPLPSECLEWIREGYADALDPVVSAWFRLYHLANLGFYSALIGYHEHADAIAAAASAEARCLEL
jgi:hypothetical protein